MARAASLRLFLVLWPVAAIEVYTPGNLEALNGTDVRLKCTFRSHEPPGKRLAVTWTFRPLSGGPDQSVFYYHEEPYPMSMGRFSGRVTWDGNIQNSDASLMLWNVSPADNGTFQCHVKNPPNDVGGNIGEIHLAVVMKVTFSEIHILALTIGSACLLMIIIVVTVVVCRQQRRKRQEKDVEMVERERSEKEKLKKEAELEEEEKGLRGERA